MGMVSTHRGMRTGVREVEAELGGDRGRRLCHSVCVEGCISSERYR